MTLQPTASSLVVAMAAEIDLTSREHVYDRLYAAFVSDVAVVIADFSATRFCDSASLRRLITVQQRAAAHGCQLRLVIPADSSVGRLADLLGLASQLLIYPSVGRACGDHLLSSAI